MSRPTERVPGAQNILLLMSGSIACAKASNLVSAWVKQGHQVRVACTRSVAQFIGHATLEGFSGHPVLGDAFTPGQVMDHIHLARWADRIIAAPATSNLINKLAAGIADDAVTSLWQAAWGQNKPMTIVPAMNTHMWNYPATRDSVHRLQAWGVQVLPTAEGDLACGETGAGRMLEPEEILRLIDMAPPAGNPVQPRKILITAGGTREPIDSVRYIGNFSSGRTAATLAEMMHANGHEVTWLGAESAKRPGTACREVTYVTYQDLARELKQLLSDQAFDAVVHAAAVSDFSVDRVEADGQTGKPSGAKLSSKNDLRLHLKPNDKLLNRMQEWSMNPDLLVIGFKLTSGASKRAREQAVAGLLGRHGVAAVVHNDLSEIDDSRHPFRLYHPAADGLVCEDSRELAVQLERLMETVI